MIRKQIKLCLLLCVTVNVFADTYTDENATQKIYSEQNWGIGVAMRSASIPYATQDKTVGNFVPLIFFENEHFFFHGLESGWKIYETEDWRFSAITRVHFVDIPQEYQNAIQADTNDVGFQARYKMQNKQSLDLEVMNDLHGRYFSNLKYSVELESGDLEYNPYVKLQWNSDKYNSYYYGLDQEGISSGFDSTLGVEAKYHLISNLYLLARAQTTLLSSQAEGSRFVEDQFANELYLGFGFFNEKDKPLKKALSISPYLRIAHGWATPSNISEIIHFNTETDPYNNQLTSLFYGYPLTDELFSLPIDLYLTPGLVFHHSSEVQSSTQEYVFAIKAYYTFPLPWEVRFGVAEGLSYAKDVTYIEASEMEEKGYEPSNLLNYLDFSLDVNLGDVFGEKMDKWWLGYSIHHRSAIFESSSRFGRIKGGSNYNTVYFQRHF